MRKFLIGLCVLAVGALTALVVVNHNEAARETDMPEEPKAKRTPTHGLELDRWPESVSARYGLAWSKDDYAVLEHFEPTQNEEGNNVYVDKWSGTRNNPSLYWTAADGYQAMIRRDVELENEDGATLQLRILVTPSYAFAKDFVAAFRGYELFPFPNFNEHDVGYGPDYGLELGHVALIADLPPFGEDFVDPEEYDGNTSNALAFIRANVVVYAALRFEETVPDFSAAELCAAIDGKIQEQYDECSGVYVLPSVSVGLGASTLAHDHRNGANQTSVTVSASHPQSLPVSRWAFIATKSWYYVSETSEEPDLTRPPYWDPDVSVLEESSWLMDDPFNTTKLEFPGAMAWPMQHNQLVIVAWGPNMLPVFAVADFEVVDANLQTPDFGG